MFHKRLLSPQALKNEWITVLFGLSYLPRSSIVILVFSHGNRSVFLRDTSVQFGHLTQLQVQMCASLKVCSRLQEYKCVFKG